MSNLAAGVSVITAGRGDKRAGLTATSVSSLSMDPPSVLVCINRCSSLCPMLREDRPFGVNLLSEGHRETAECFAGRRGLRGAARYADGSWVTLVTGAPILADALAALDCTVEKVIEWHSHAIVIGIVQAVHLPGGSRPLVYWRGAYDQCRRSNLSR